MPTLHDDDSCPCSLCQVRRSGQTGELLYPKLTLLLEGLQTERLSSDAKGRIVEAYLQGSAYFAIYERPAMVIRAAKDAQA